MNLNELKELAQKKKGRDVPCDALESALEIIVELKAKDEWQPIETMPLDIPVVIGSSCGLRFIATKSDWYGISTTEIVTLDEKRRLKFWHHLPKPPKQNH